MNTPKGLQAILSGLVIATGLLMAALPSYAETASERSRERQQALRHPPDWTSGRPPG